MLVRERWMLCLTWLLGWEGLEEGALGAGGTSRFRVSFSSVGADEGFWHDAEADVWLLGRGWGPACFLGITYEVLVTIRAPVSWCLGADVDEDCSAGDRIDFVGICAIEGSRSSDCCSATRLFTGSFAFSWRSSFSGAGSVARCKEAKLSLAESSGHCVEGVSVSMSATSSTSFMAVRKKNSRAFWES